MDWLPVGKVVAVQGLRGEVKVIYYNEVKEDFLLYASLFVVKDSEKVEIKPLRVRFQKRLVYVVFEGVNNLDRAASLVGKELYVQADHLPALSEDEYYEFQLIGLNVIGRKGEKIGTTVSMLHTGANDVLVAEGKEEFLIPMVEGFVVRIDVNGGFIEVDEEALAP